MLTSKLKDKLDAKLKKLNTNETFFEKKFEVSQQTLFNYVTQNRKLTKKNSL